MQPMSVETGEMSGQKRCQAFSPAPRPSKRARTAAPRRKRARAWPSPACATDAVRTPLRTYFRARRTSASASAAYPDVGDASRRRQRTRLNASAVAEPSPASRRRQERAARLEERIAQRQREQREQQAADAAEAAERATVSATVSVAIRARAANKDARQTLLEFTGSAPPANAPRATLRKALRRALAAFHPDRARRLPLTERIEREEIYKTLQPLFERC